MTIDDMDRIKAEIADSFDEELEMQLDEDRLDELVAQGVGGGEADTLDRKVYFRELFRLQHELVRLQDWIQYKKLKVVVLFEGAILLARAAPSNASRNASIRASAASSRCQRRPSASVISGISNAMCSTYRRPAKWSCSTAVGTTAPASNG